MSDAARYMAERKQSETALLESRNLLQTVIDTAPMRVFWKDRDLRYLGCNPIFARDAWKSRPGDLLGKEDFQVGWAEDGVKAVALAQESAYDLILMDNADAQHGRAGGHAPDTPTARLQGDPRHRHDGQCLRRGQGPLLRGRHE